MIASVDESVGRVIALLDELKLSDHTLVIFSSDNGGVGGYQRAGIRDYPGITDNAPLRGGKGMLYEGGIRVPYIFRWQGRVAAGTTCDQPINSVDLYPTLLELARADKPADYALDGRSYLPLLTGSGSRPAGELFWHFPGYLGAGPGRWRTLPVGVIRDGDFKLLEFFEDQRIELYNTRDDIGERHDLAARMPEKAKALQARLHAWRQAVGAKMPAPHKERSASAPDQPARSDRKAARRQRRAGQEE
jgi:arylsulfatase A-like enzyme